MKKLLYLALLLSIASQLPAQRPLSHKDVKHVDLSRYTLSGNKYARIKGRPPQPQSSLRQNNLYLQALTADSYNFDLQVWEKSYKIEFNYLDAQGLHETQSDYFWQENLNDWQIDYQTDYWLLPNGALDSVLYRSWEESSNTLEPQFSEKKEYLPNGNLALERAYSYGQSSGQWWLYALTNYTYNAQNQLIEKIQGLDIPQNKTTYGYNGNQLTEEIYAYYLEGVNLWVPSSKVAYVYNGAGLLAVEENYYYNEMISDWSYNNKFEYEYDNAGRLISTTYYDWGNNNTWIPDFQYTVAFNANGHLDQEQESEWNSATNSWEPVYQANFSRDESVPASDLYFPFVFRNGEQLRYFTSRLDTVFEFYYEFNDWVLSDRTALSWSPDLSNTQHLPDTDFALFPNPTGDLIHFQTERDLSGATFQLFDVHGRLQLQKELNHQQPVSTAGLPDGVYFYQLGKNGDWRARGTVLIHR